MIMIVVSPIIIQENWTPLWEQKIGGDGQETYINRVDGSISILTSQGSNSIYISDDYGDTYPWSNDDVIPGSGPGFNHWFEEDVDDHTILYSQKYDIWKHSNFGLSGTPDEWVQISNFSPCGYTIDCDTDSDDYCLEKGTVNRFFTAPNHANVMYALVSVAKVVDSDNCTVKNYRKIFKTSQLNNADPIAIQNSWVEFELPDIYECNGQFVPGDENIRFIKDISPTFENPDNFWITFSGLTFTDGTGECVKDKVYKYENGTYTDRTMNLPNTSAQYIRILPGSNEILLGTDYGVFYTNADLMEEYDNNQSGGWLLYGTKLPNVFISAMELNIAINKLRVGLYGRGVWEVDLPCTKLSTPIYITENTTWNTFQRLSQDVIVTNGATLKIEDETFHFVGHAGIKVDKGAKLIVNDATLTSACPDELWLGIEVWGDPAFSQTSSNQGTCQLNNATIENAHTGVWLRKNTVEDCQEIPNTGGGIVYAKNSLFYNCYIGAEFAPYRQFSGLGNPYPNKSYFRDCIFKADRKLNGGFDMKYGIHLEEVNIVRISGCEFRFEDFNTIPPDVPSPKGIGIKSTNASFTASSICSVNVPIGQLCPEEGLLENNNIWTSSSRLYQIRSGRQ